MCVEMVSSKVDVTAATLNMEIPMPQARRLKHSSPENIIQATWKHQETNEEPEMRQTGVNAQQYEHEEHSWSAQTYK